MNGIINLLQQLSELTIASIVEIHKSPVAERPVPVIMKKVYFIGRDKPWAFKRPAVEHFFEWVEENYVKNKVATIMTEKAITRGLFAAFVRGDPVLLHHCTEGKRLCKNIKRHINTVKHHGRAAELYCARRPLAFEDSNPQMFVQDSFVQRMLIDDEQLIRSLGENVGISELG